MRNCILNNCIKIEQCKDNKNINELIKYYNKYNIIIEAVKIEDIKNIKTITDHTDSVIRECDYFSYQAIMSIVNSIITYHYCSII